MKKKSSQHVTWLVAGIMAFCVVAGGYGLYKVLMSDDGHKRKRHMQIVTLLPPPPPPEIREKPPEPEKKEIIEPEKQDEPEENEDQSQDETPPGEQLGVDAEGSAGSDGFGLVGKKGGRALIGGDLGSGSLLRKYAWYNRIVEEEIRRKVHELLQENGGVPDGDLKAMIEIHLDEEGRIVQHRIEGSSGDRAMDEAVGKALKVTQISEPPPDGMPRGMRLSVSSKG